VVTLGGVAVIASVMAILVLIAGTTVPLFLPAHAQRTAQCRLPQSVSAPDVVGLGCDLAVGGAEGVVFAILRDGSCRIVDITSGNLVLEKRLTAATGAAAKTIHSVSQLTPTCYGVWWSDGSLQLVEFVRAAGAAAQAGGAAYSVKTQEGLPAEKGVLPLRTVVRRVGENTLAAALLMPDRRIIVIRQSAEENMLGEVTTSAKRLVLDKDLPEEVTALAMDSQATALYASTATGGLVMWEFTPELRVRRREAFPAFRDRRKITALELVLGDVTLAVGDEKGNLTAWLPVRYTDKGDRKLVLGRELEPHTSPIREIMPSARSKSLLSCGEDGAVHLDHVTSQRHLVTIVPEKPWQRIAFAPRGDALVGLDADGNLTTWSIHCPHPEVSWRTLFGKVLYEGYDRPEYVWQTTGGEDYEPKYCLVPLLFGTFKGTFYAMLLAVPLALLGAIYISQFTTPSVKRTIKPVVEIMAALPSVVIGFLCALLLAPLVGQYVVVLFASLLTIPLVLVAWLIVWQWVRRRNWARRLERGYEFLILIPLLVAGVLLAMWLAGPIESLCFGGNFKTWLFQSLHMRYDQRNCLIIAFGLGLAVIPIIFSLSEDALSNVPQSISAASLALGASRWQTLARVVLPSASPGIFAAVMIGFGRAVGETMIVLMATGNTPIVDFSPFNGMRTLSANIAVEISEAPVGGTLYRVLFLCAVLLFLLTFLLNTTAELVRQRLRARFGRY
jgi:phosphate transport system permease protein